MNSSRGFTLVEILVVIVIIGLMAGMAVLSIGHDPQRQLQQEAQRVRTILQLAADEALLQGREYGLVLEQNGYQIVQFNEQKRQWQKSEAANFARYELPERVQISLQSEDTNIDLSELNRPDSDTDKKNNSSIKPALLLLSSGEMTPFILQFSAADSDDNKSNSYQLSSDGLSEIKLELNDA